jgi:hypothetical protein
MDTPKLKLPIRKGTQASYAALETKDPGTVYILVDVTEGNNIFLGELPLGKTTGQKIVRYVLFDKTEQIFTFAYTDGSSNTVDLVLDGIVDTTDKIQELLAAMEASILTASKGNSVKLDTLMASILELKEDSAKLDVMIELMQELSASALTRADIENLSVVQGTGSSSTSSGSGSSSSGSSSSSSGSAGLSTADRAKLDAMTAMMQEIADTMLTLSDIENNLPAAGGSSSGGSSSSSSSGSGLSAADRAKMNTLIELMQQLVATVLTRADIVSLSISGEEGMPAIELATGGGLSPEYTAKMDAMLLQMERLSQAMTSAERVSAGTTGGTGMVRHGTVTIAPGDWRGVTAPFSFTVTHVDIVEGCVIEAFPVQESQDALDNAEVYSELTADAGSFTIRVRKIPTGNITVKYILHTNVRHGTATITPDDWTGTDGLFLATVTDADITDGCMVESFPVQESQDAFYNTEIYPEMVMNPGSFTIQAKRKPTETLTVKYIIRI